MRKVHGIVVGLARIVALLGGMVLLALILLTCISIIGRAVNGALHSGFMMSIAPGFSQGLIDAGIGAIRGDFELVEAGMAFCIFAFLPFCQVTAGHATVDVFTNFLPRGANRTLEAAIAVLFAGVLVLIAVQLYGGMERKMSSGQTSFLLEFPVWWAYAASLFGASMAALCGIWVVVVRVYEVLSGRTVMVNAVGANH